MKKERRAELDIEKGSSGTDDYPGTMTWMLARALAKRWEGHVQAWLSSREIKEFGVPTRPAEPRGKATSLAALSRVVRGPRAVGRTRACT